MDTISRLCLDLLHMIDQLLDETERKKHQFSSQALIINHPSIKYLATLFNQHPKRFVLTHSDGVSLNIEQIARIREYFYRRQQELEDIKQLQKYGS